MEGIDFPLTHTIIEETAYWFSPEGFVVLENVDDEIFDRLTGAGFRFIRELVEASEEEIEEYADIPLSIVKKSKRNRRFPRNLTKKPETSKTQEERQAN